MRVTMALIMAVYFVIQVPPEAAAHQDVATVIVPPVPTVTGADDYNPAALRRGGSFRSPRSGYTGGGRTGVTPGYGNGRAGGAPGARTPAAPASRFGGFLGGMFGGLLAGSLLGSLINPLGFGVPGGFSLIGVLFWAVILYLLFRLVRGRFGAGGPS